MRHDENESQQARAVREQLTRLVQTHGPEILDDSRRVRAMLADAVAGATAETNLIGLALASGVAAKLRESAGAPGVIDSTARDLERTSSVQPSDARWAVSAVAAALGITPVEERQARPATAPAAVGRADGPQSPDDLLIRIGGREHVAKPGDVVTIGREPGSTVVLESSAVSRQHARIQRGSAGWEYHDLGSTQGSFVNGVAVPAFTLGEETEVVLGQGPDKVSVRLVPFGLAGTSTPSQPQPQRPAAAPAARTEIPGGRPGGVLAGGAARTELGSGATEGITVTVGGRSRTISPGAKLTVGREEDNDLVAFGTTVSRKHVQVEHQKDGWHVRDLGTTSGTWLDGKRVSDVLLSGRQELVLGDPQQGDRLVTDTATNSSAASSSAKRSAPALSGKLAGALAAAMAVVVVVAGVTWWLNSDDDNDATPRAAALTDDQLARATVKLSSEAGRASGVVIDKDKGLIVTNAHVAAPSAPGVAVNYSEFSDDEAENPAQIVVSVADGLDESAEPRFYAELVTYDGYLDVAVIKIVKKYSGALVDEGDLKGLTEVPLGDSEGLKTSDAVKLIGYPSAAAALTPSMTSGNVSAPVQDDRLGESRAMINTTATSSSGNSGGLAADAQGRMVGLVTLSRLDSERNRIFSSFRPINLVKPVIEAAQKGQAYTSKYVVAGPASAKVQDPGYARPGEPGGVAAGCTKLGRMESLLGISFRYSGFPGGKHTDVLAAIVDPSDPSRVLATARTTYPTKLAASGCLTLTFDRPLPQGSYRLKVGVGGNYRVRFDTTYENL